MTLSILPAAALAGGCGTDSTEPIASSSSALFATDPLDPLKPTVNLLLPKHGPSAGGYTLTVLGENFSTTAGATTFAIDGWATDVACSTSRYCTMTVPASRTPDLTTWADVRANVRGKWSDTIPEDTFQYDGTGPVCTGVFTCTGTFGTVTDAFFQCDLAEGTLSLLRSGQVVANATVFQSSPQETDIYELGAPNAPTTDYQVCVTSYTGRQDCGRTIHLDTSLPCVCTPKTCASLGATCGFPSDGCGGTLICGTCASGSSCSSNQCCPTGTTWSGWQSACVPPTTCTTAACQCQAQGGTWTGKLCI